MPCEIKVVMGILIDDRKNGLPFPVKDEVTDRAQDFPCRVLNLRPQ